MKLLTQGAFKGKIALVRVDFNVPLTTDGHITDDRRIRASLPTINYILAQGGSVVLTSHLGRPKHGPDDKYSLRHLHNHLAELLGRNVLFVSDCTADLTYEVCRNLHPGDVVLLENVRFHAEEEKGDLDFAEILARLGDVYVNDAFGTAHRAHASTTVVAGFFKEKYAGFLMAAELDNARRVLEAPERPFVVIMGGAKVSDKIELIRNFLPRIDTLVIGGAMAYTFLQAQGHEIGLSLCETDKLDLARALMDEAQAQAVRLILPVDSVVAPALQGDAKTSIVRNDAMLPDQTGLDIGPQAVADIREVLQNAKTILWNGPMGVFEFKAFAEGTKAVAEAVAEATERGAYSLIGGGDSAAAVEQFGVAGRVSYVSTGGGALLEYLEGKTLPGVAALGA